MMPTSTRSKCCVASSRKCRPFSIRFALAQLACMKSASGFQTVSFQTLAFRSVPLHNLRTRPDTAQESSHTMADFTVIKEADAPRPARQTGRLAARMREYEKFVEAVGSGKVGKLVPARGETARGIALR